MQPGGNPQNEKALSFLRSDPKHLSPDEYRNLFADFIEKVRMMYDVRDDRSDDP